MSDVSVAETHEEVEQKATQLPKPQGYRVLCMVPHMEKTYGDTIIKADATLSREEQTTHVLFVVELGDMAYMDEKRFPTGPWCKKGDFILTRPYAGTRFKIHGQEFRLINDDTVEGVVEDPRGITHA
jgi:co-chaperonin GroES (HSP10)